jgi:AraC-like DNA-binding protein
MRAKTLGLGVRTGTGPAARGREPAFFSRQITHAERFFLSGPPGKGAATLIYGGNERCAANYHIARADFPYYSVEFVAGGEGWLEMGGERVRLMPGAVFAYGPGVAHDIKSSAERPLDKYFVGVHALQSQRLPPYPPAPRQLSPRPGEVLQTSAPTDIQQLYEDLIKAGRRESRFCLPICGAVVEHLLLRLAETVVPLGTIGTEAFETFQQCRRYIEANYRQVESLGAIATDCRVDPAYVCRLFKRFAFQSPWHYVLRLKMRDAAQLLQSEQVRVGQVADALGFTDPFQFSRTFRRVFGMSPRQFVQRQRRH